jgi:FkbM family methyltransferase
MTITTKELTSRMELRAGVTSDQYVCAEVCGEYKHLPVEGKTVMDIGGNIGAFSKYAVMKGANKVITYEPSAENFTQLLRNISNEKDVIPVYAALVNNDDLQTNFYLTNGLAKDGYSTIEFRGRRKVVTPALNFYKEVEKYRPNSIKMDIEGGEFYLLNKPLPTCIESIVVEIHFSKSYFRKEFSSIIDNFPPTEWECIIQPKETGTNFHTLAQYNRI